VFWLLPDDLSAIPQVWEVVGNTVDEIVVDSPYHVLLLVQKPECQACQQVCVCFGLT
jgi:hypothetical protein